jgi:hypothetical protein
MRSRRASKWTRFVATDSGISCHYHTHKPSKTLFFLSWHWFAPWMNQRSNHSIVLFTDNRRLDATEHCDWRTRLDAIGRDWTRLDARGRDWTREDAIGRERARLDVIGRDWTQLHTTGRVQRLEAYWMQCDCATVLGAGGCDCARLGSTGCDWVWLGETECVTGCDWVRLVRLDATATRRDWMQLDATVRYGWMWMDAIRCNWMRLGAGGCDWVRLGATGCDCTAGCDWMGSGCDWVWLGAIGATGCEYMQLDATGCDCTWLGATGRDDATRRDWMRPGVGATGRRHDSARLDATGAFTVRARNLSLRSLPVFQLRVVSS